MFDEVTLELGINYGTMTTLTYNTTIGVDDSGCEQRNANWSQPLLKFEIGDRTLSRSDLEYLNQFHLSRQGSYKGFRFKDWSDYLGKLQPAIQKQSGIYQLAKTYPVGADSVIRPIHKPVAGTVRVYVDGDEWVSGWTVDTTTGIISFSYAIANNAIVTADFEFDVPVRFEQDNLDFRLEAHIRNTSEKIFSLQRLTLVEIRSTNEIVNSVASFLNHTIDLGIDLRTVGGQKFNTTIVTTGANFEARSPNWVSPRGDYNIGDQTLNRKELDYLISLFRVAHGAASGFSYFDLQNDESIPVRFGSDSMSTRFDAIDPDTGEVIFNLAGLNLTRLQQPTSITQTIELTFDPDAITTHSFTITAPDEVIAWGSADIYLVIGDWDDCGSIGTYTAPCVVNQTQSIVCPTPLLIGTGLSVSGTVQNVVQSGCSVQISLLWQKIHVVPQ
jgi:uncharacterized protein (TIGR02217 family)